MAHLLPASPKPTKQQSQKVLNNVTPKVKLFFLLCVLLLYMMIVLFLKSMTDKASRFDRMELMVMETKQMIHQIHTMDQNLAMEMERLDDMLNDC